jgi:hypothetical protein
MSYIAPHLRKPVVKPVDMTANAFPELGNTRVAAAPTGPSLASRAKAWNDKVEVVVDTDRVAKLREKATRDAKAALRVFCRQPLFAKPDYVRQDDLFQNRLDELEDQEAYEYAEQDAEFEQEAVDGWTDVKYKVLRQRTRGSSPPRQEMSESDIRSRIDVLQKRVRKNGTLREDIVVFEKELAELYKQLKSVESAGVPEHTKHWD